MRSSVLQTRRQWGARRFLATVFIVLLLGAAHTQAQRGFTVQPEFLKLNGDGLPLPQAGVQAIPQPGKNISIPAVHKRGVVTKPGAHWIQLLFDSYNLGKDSRLTITAKKDNASITYSESSLARSRGQTILFNGDTVSLDLQIAAGEKNIFIAVQNVVLGTPPAQPSKDKPSSTKESLTGTKEAMCGFSDNRSSLTDMRIGRLMPVECTGFLFGGVFLTAGHCARNSMNVIQFNVPISEADGQPENPKPENQYPIGKVVKNDPGQKFGHDWAVFKVLPNAKTGLLPPALKTKKGFASYLGSLPASVRVSGYGVSYDPPGAAGYANSKSFTLQTAIGSTLGKSSDGSYLSYATVTDEGNSGSPVIAVDPNGADTDQVIAIHTDGPCHPGNLGTAIGDPDLQAAIAAMQ
jgi:hypothetical protein